MMFFVCNMIMYVLFCFRCLRWNEVFLIVFCCFIIFLFVCSNVIIKFSIILFLFLIDLFYVMLNFNMFCEILCIIGGLGGFEILYGLIVFYLIVYIIVSKI